MQRTVFAGTPPVRAAELRRDSEIHRFVDFGVRLVGQAARVHITGEKSMASYAKVKAAVIDVVDDFTKKDVAANYIPLGTATFSAKTKLASLNINETVLATMTIRFNKVLEAVCSPKWTHVGAFDLVQKTTIGDLILLACAKSTTTVPPGEPT